jgi:hypothetical protein
VKVRIPWHARLLLLRPKRVLHWLARIDASPKAKVPVPNLWQIELGILRMWHRIIFRSETIGTCTDHIVRPGWRAWLLQFRPIRFPFLVWERAIAPWDLSGLLSDEAQFERHLLGAHHDGTQCVYDLQILSLCPGALARLERRLLSLVEQPNQRGRWLADLVVFERYHIELLKHVRTILAGSDELVPSDGDDPDISFWAYLRWCARQPSSPREWCRAVRAGRFGFEDGLISEAR